MNRSTSLSNLIRWSGLANIAGGVIIVLTRILEALLFGHQPLSVQATSTAFLPVLGIPGLVASLFFLLGLVGVYARQAQDAGTFGVAAFLIAFVGLSLSLGGNWAYAFAAPELAKAAPGVLDNPAAISGVLSAGLMVSYLLGVVGWLCIGLATFRANVLPRWSAVALMGSIVLVGVMLPLFGSLSPFVKVLFNVLISTGPVALGYAVWTEKGTTQA